MPGTIGGMVFEAPLPDASKLLAAWMLWERGESTPGRAIADLKTAGMKELLEGLVEAALHDA